MGWVDMAHFHPHVMPWAELDLLCRAVALRDPALRHPGPMPALLLRFTFLSEDEDLDAITPLVDAAFAVRPAEAGHHLLHGDQVAPTRWTVPRPASLATGQPGGAPVRSTISYARSCRTCPRCWSGTATRP